MGASDEKNSLPKNCPTAQQFGDFFEAKIAAVRKATGGGDLPPATETFDRFQPCSVTDVKTAIMGASSKSCELDPISTDILEKFLPELLPFITDLCNASLQQGCLPLSQRHAIIRPCIKKAGLDTSGGRDGRVVSVTGLGSRGRGLESRCRKKWWAVMEFVNIYHVEV